MTVVECERLFKKWKCPSTSECRCIQGIKEDFFFILLTKQEQDQVMRMLRNGH